MNSPLHSIVVLALMCFTLVQAQTVVDNQSISTSCPSLANPSSLPITKSTVNGTTALRVAIKAKAAIYRLSENSEGKPNGEECKFDADCESNNCEHGQCEDNQYKHSDNKDLVIFGFELSTTTLIIIIVVAIILLLLCFASCFMFCGKGGRKGDKK